jgi:tetratricopeptide (TPR) repeat protein
MVTRDRDRDRAPTLEVPFPEALEVMPAGAGTRAVNPAGTVAAVIPPPAAPAVAKPPRVPVRQQLRHTLTNVRAMPLWRRSIAPPIFIAVVAALVIALVAGVVTIRARQPEVPAIDTAGEARRARERQLRQEADALIRQGRVTDAYAKYLELQRLAPKSPYVNATLQKLNAIRQQEEISKQQIAQAQLRFDEGLALFNERKYADATERFQEAFSLNPNSMQAAEYLKLSQEEQQKAEAARLARQQQRQAGRTTAGTSTASTTRAETATSATSTTAPAEPVQITTSFTHPFTDGNIIVRIGGDIVASEQLFVERPARLFRRASRQPRVISAAKQFPAKNADVQIWITVPAAGIQEHHNIPGVRFEAGGSHRLTVRYDAASKKFTYELN